MDEDALTELALENDAEDVVVEKTLRSHLRDRSI